MNILFLSNILPPHAGNPGPQRVFYFARELSKHHNLSLLILGTEEASSNENTVTEEYSSIFSQISFAPFTPPTTPTSLQRYLHRYTIQPHYSTKYVSPRVHALRTKAVVDALAHADHLFVSGLSALQYLPREMPAPVTLDLCDSGTLLYARAARAAPNVGRRLQLAVEAASYAVAERRACLAAANTLAVSTHDADALKQLAPKANIHCLGLGVDTAYFAPHHSGQDDKAPLVSFLGVMNYEPNALAATFIIEQVEPLLRSIKPEARIQLLGAEPPPALYLLNEKHGGHVKISGSVPDIRPYLPAGSIFISPIKNGSGIKQKLLTAAALQCPIIATKRSLEGLRLVPDKDCIVAESADEFVRAICMLIDEPQKADQLRAHAYSHVLETHSWESLGSELERLIATSRPR